MHVYVNNIYFFLCAGMSGPPNYTHTRPLINLQILMTQFCASTIPHTNKNR